MKWTNLLIRVLMVLFSIQLLWAGSTGKIAGKITDATTGDPLIGVNVVIAELGMGAATDFEGEFYIINIPVGVYSLQIQMIGYQTVNMTDVLVKADLTTTANMELLNMVLESEESVIVEAERPLIQKDLTASRNIMTAEDIENIPVQDVTEIVELGAGFVDGHARGGRAGEVIYMINGVAAVDPWNNTYEAEVPQGSVEEISVYTGGFSAEYGNAQSGVINIITKEGGTHYSGKLRYRTSALGKKENALQPDEDVFFSLNDHHRLQNFEYSFGGPVPFTPVNFFVSGEFKDDQGRWDNTYDKLKSLNWKISGKPTPQDKLICSGLYSVRDQGNYSHDYRLPTMENEDMDGDGILDRVQTVFGDSSIYEISNDPADIIKRYRLKDLDGDGDYINEDRNSDGLLTVVDLNHDGDFTDALDMLSHIEVYESQSNQFSLNWSHTFSATSYMEVILSRYQTEMRYNINEKFNEDANMNGILDEGEDYNGNNRIDPDDWDLLTDFDDDGYIDASQYEDWDPAEDVSTWGSRSGTPEDWMVWEVVELGDGAEDGDKLKLYGNGKNYDRFRWNFDQKTIYTFKTNYTNQWNKRNTVRTGFEFSQYNIFDHDVDIASGGNVYGQNIGKIDGHGTEDQADLRPYISGLYAENKMEYDGMIVNAGLRLDYFDPATNTYEVDEYEQIVDTLSVDSRYYISPRLGIAHPITERDVFYFNYGQYFQIPIFRLLYTNLNWDLSGAFPRVGNPALQPERTTSYEIGIRHQFTDDVAGELKGFYKDISGLTTTQSVFYSASNYYDIFINTDYGNVRGLEFSLDKRFGNYFGGSIDYTFSVAKGKASTPEAASRQTWAGQIVPKKEQYLDWDQRHTINAMLNFAVPYVDVHGNVTANYGSGLPYTPPSYSLDVPLNTERLPATLSGDMYLEKQFELNTGQSIQLFMWVNNVFGIKNIENTSPVMNPGRIQDANWYVNYTVIQEHYEEKDAVFFGSEDDNNGTDDDHDGFIDETLEDEYMVLMDTDGDDEVDENKLYPAGGRLADPTYYSQPRTWRVGLSIEF